MCQQLLPVCFLRMRFFLIMIIVNDFFGKTMNTFFMCSSLSISRNTGNTPLHYFKNTKQQQVRYCERQALPPPLQPLQIQGSISSSTKPVVVLPIKQQQSQADRRTFLAAAATTSMTFTTLPKFTAMAANLPQSTGADLSATGTIETLVPVVHLLESLQTIKDRLLKNAETSLSSIQFVVLTEANTIIPKDEKSFKRIFDAYSQPVSYKQTFMDQNAFLVYYTQGYDGPNRPRLEDEQQGSAKLQTLQYGARNDAWTAWNDFVVELDYVMKMQTTNTQQQGSSSSAANILDNNDTTTMVNDLLEPLNRTIDSVSVYVNLAPASDVQDAYQRVARK